MEERLNFHLWFQREKVLVAGEAEHGGRTRKLAENIFFIAQGSKAKENRNWNNATNPQSPPQ